MPLKPAVAVIVAISATGALAQETLYGRQPPPGSTYVRVVNAGETPVVAAAGLHAAWHLGVAAADRVGPYTAIEPDASRHLTVTADGQEASLDVPPAPDGYVSVIVEPGIDGLIRLVAAIDPFDFNQNRVRIAFYNASSTCPLASLVTDPGGAPVIQTVERGTGKSRTVNPVRALLRATCGTTPLASLTIAGLEIGTSYSVWLLDPAGGLIMTHDVIAPYKPRS